MSKLPIYLALATNVLIVGFTPVLGADDQTGEDPAPLLERVDRVIAKVRTRELSSLSDTPWVVMHAVIAFEKNLEVVDVRAEKKVGAIDYLCQHATHEGKQIFRDENGRPALPTRGLRYGLQESFKVQDHADQFLMAFADADVALNTPILAEGGKRFTVEDMLAAAKANLTDEQELGWTLVATSTYLAVEDRWTAGDGKSYRIEDLVALAIRRDPRRETEGGPHHLYGVAYALDTYRGQQRGALSESWAEARSYLDRYIRLAKEYQQADGSFSADMFRGSRPSRDPRQMVWATGHTLEWLTVALTAEQLQEDWVRRGVEALVQVMESQPLNAFSDGGLYHAAHALIRYSGEVTD
ncbi:MAG: hypothetical protein CMJ64_03080 [Planctomycetaceae bacterium]|nr:hypothetical protein [Planctomycetaceae bacterium]